MLCWLFVIVLYLLVLLLLMMLLLVAAACCCCLLWRACTSVRLHSLRLFLFQERAAELERRKRVLQDRFKRIEDKRREQKQARVQAEASSGRHHKLRNARLVAARQKRLLEEKKRQEVRASSLLCAASSALLQAAAWNEE